MSLPIFNLGLCCSEQSKEIKVAISHVHPRARNTLDVFVCVEEERSERERAKKERRAFGLLTVLWSASLASLYMKQRFGRRYRSLFSPLSFSYIETKAPLVLVLKWKKNKLFSFLFSRVRRLYPLVPLQTRICRTFSCKNAIIREEKPWLVIERFELRFLSFVTDKKCSTQPVTFQWTHTHTLTKFD